MNIETYGRGIEQSDLDRAEAAAEKIFATHGTTPEAACTAYMRQWLEYDDEEPMTGVALVVIEARSAANIALTEGWHNPEGAGVVGISV